MSAIDNISRVANELGLTMDAKFVPWSQSRNKGEEQPSLNWSVTIRRNGRDVLTIDYSAGIAHCSAYSAPGLGLPNSINRYNAIKFECEHGRGHVNGTKPLMPKLEDVFYSLVLDSSVLDESSFESWAASFGYDSDSRKAEKIYRDCLEIALKLRNALGDTGLALLKEACQDY